MKKYVFLLLFAQVILSCVTNNEEELYDCLPTKATYTSLKPVFDNNCIECHNPGYFNKNVILTTYEGVKAAAASGKLLKVVTHSEGVTPMPYGRNQLPECELESIQSWIERDMPQN